MLRFRFWSNWILLPRTMRMASTTAVLIMFTSAALLYQTNVRADRPPAFARGGTFAGELTDPAADDEIALTSPTPAGGTAPLTRSSATIKAPSTATPEVNFTAGGTRFPTLGRYVFRVDGYEQASGFGRRNYPAEMTATVHRSQPADPSVPGIKDDEVIVDLYFSDDHEEREILAYRSPGVLFTYEAGSISYGFTQTSEATYDPPMLQIPAPLAVGETRSGTTQAKDPDGTVTRTEDWTVRVVGTEQLQILGEPVETWIVEIKRQSRPGSDEEVTRSRTYWFDPQRALWVKWHERMQGSQDFGPGTFTYTTEFTATLERVAPA